MNRDHYDIEAERALLGSMLRDADIARLARERVGLEDFYKLGHQDVFTAICDVMDEADDTDVLLVKAELEVAGKLESSGGHPYLAELLEAPTAIANVEWYAGLVLKCSRRRAIHMALEDGIRAVQDGADLDEVEARLLKAIESGDTDDGKSAVRPLGTFTDAVDARIEARATGEPDGAIPTGIGALDRVFRGLMPGRLTVFGATSGTGKTALATAIGGHIAVRLGKPVLMVSAEMAAPDLCENALRQLAQLETDRTARGSFLPDELARWREAKQALEGAPFLIDDTAAPAIEDVVNRSLRAVRERGVQIILVDYVQLLTTRGRHQTETLRVGHIAKGLKGLARKANVPVVALSQITISDEGAIRTRWATEVEFHADALLLLLREGKFEGNREPEPDTATRLLRIVKNRFGPQRGVKLTFDKRRLNFGEYKEPADEE